jgi:hypothetical protein
MANQKTNCASTKYSPVGAAPVPATPEEQMIHLQGFIAQFIEPGRRARWTHCLIDRPEKASSHLHRFGADQAARCCTELKGAESFPQFLEATFGLERGLYFDGITAPCKMTAAEAATMAAENFRDVLVSFVPGKKVLFFDHDRAVWRCECL